MDNKDQQMNARPFALLCCICYTVGILQAQCDLPPGWMPTVYNTSATASGLTAPTGADVQINTPFDINDDVTLTTCDVGVRGQGAITVKSGSTLTLTSNTLLTHINSYWTGIVVENGAELIVNGNSTICHAQVAINVQITSAGDVTIDNASLVQNETGVAFGAFSGGLHPATITGTTIDGGYPTALPTGLGATYGQVGIEAKNVNDGGSPISLGLQIGSTASVNTIKNLAIGIDNVNSTMLVQNCTFENIVQAASASGDPGIAILGRMNGVSSADMRIGTTTSGGNTFTDCDHGIDLMEFDYVKIGDNTFEESTGDFQRGIWVRESYNTVIIEDNDIKDFSDEGILVEDNGGATMNIRDNTITGTGLGCDQVGIDVVETAGTGSVTFAVRDNVISGVAIGISAINAEDIEISSTNPTAPQDIEFTQPAGCSGDLAFGVRLEDCDGALVENNVISGLCTSCTNSEIVGIGIRRSVDTYLNGNEVELSGFGVLIAQNCELGNANCNTLENCRFGFGFQDVATGEYGPVEYEGSPGEPSDNAWFPASTADRSLSFSGSDAGSFSWFYRAAGSTPAPATEHDASISNSFSMLPATALSPTSVVSSIDLCGATMRIGVDGNQDGMPPVARTTDGTSYEILYANYFIGSDTLLMDSAASTSIPAFHDMVDRINAKNHAAAAGTYSSIGAISSMEEDIADALYLAAKARYRRFSDTLHGKEELASYLAPSEVSRLEALAWSPYTESGKASSIAAAILGISTWRIDSAAFKEGHVFETSDGPQSILTISPNPANNRISVEWSEGVEWIELYNSNGGKLRECHIAYQESWKTIDVSSLPPGAYLLATCSTHRGQCQYRTFIISR
jgi:hypothetical protein